MIRCKYSQSGFTLVEAAIVLVIGGMLLAAGASMFKTYLKEAAMQTTQSRMQDIDNAIVQYLNINGVLPCVASMTDPQDSANFGVEISAIVPTNIGTGCATFANPANGTWTTPGAIPPSSIPPPNTTPGTVIMGAVPVRTLNLPDADIADAWGDRFTYAVTDALTISTPTSGYDQTQGAIYVRDSHGYYIAPPNTATPSITQTAAQYVLVSYGADRAGSYTIAGIKNGMSCPAAPALENWNCNLPTNTFIKTILTNNQAGANYFDDYVLFHSLIASNGVTPTNMIAPFATACPLLNGWITYVPPPPNDQPSACTPCPECTPAFVCCQKQ